jgi:hypothetical protein
LRLCKENCGSEVEVEVKTEIAAETKAVVVADGRWSSSQVTVAHYQE